MSNKYERCEHMAQPVPNFKRYFSYRELWEQPVQFAPRIRRTLSPYQLFYHDTIKNETRMVTVYSELACWRIIDLALFMLRVNNGETDLEFPERHKRLERKAFRLAFGNDYYDPKRFDPTADRSDE